MMRCLVVALVLHAWTPFELGAWNARGHRVVAAIAFSRLDEAVQQRLISVLAFHPEIERWAAQYAEDAEPVSRDLYLVMRASSWPDEIRARRGSLSRPGWHYVSYPLHPPEFPFEDRGYPDGDALAGLALALQRIPHPDATEEERAIYLCWMLHIVADVHNPTHAASLVNDQYPAGDRGGNEFYVRHEGRGYRLHELWDGLPGSNRAADAAAHRGSMLLRLFGRRADIVHRSHDTNPVTWVRESRAHAIEEVYLRGRLRGGTDRRSARELPVSYIERARSVTNERLLLAGLRLARLIEDVL